MRIAGRMRCENFGRVQISELQRVIEIDSYSSFRPTPTTATGDVIIPQEALYTILPQMVIVIACMNEDEDVIEGVLSGIPHDCYVILVSNSDRNPSDKYEAEQRLLEKFCARSQRPAIAIHQGDVGVAAAFSAAGMPELVSSIGTIHAGKGEAMIIGMALAQLTGRKYIGYIDADNFVPGSVNEYCKVFAAGLYAAKSKRAMVRISWNSKPKIRDNRIVFDKKGRSSRVVNEWFNRLLQMNSELIVTGNAGEHAMTLELGLKLHMAGGYAIEPYELINILEQYGRDNTRSFASTPAGMPPVPSLTRADSGIVQVLQIETRNPHFHDSNKGENHVRKMLLQGLNVMHNSPLTPNPLREELAKFIEDQDGLCGSDRPQSARIYPPVGSLNFDMLLDTLTTEADSFRQYDPELMPINGAEPCRL